MMRKMLNGDWSGGILFQQKGFVDNFTVCVLLAKRHIKVYIYLNLHEYLKMNITRKNFREKFDELKEVVNAANFIAIDCEFTGLSQENVKVLLYDSPSEYFHKICQQTSGYIAIQIGMTAFRSKEEDAENFTYRSYNFFVFPQLKKQRFECQGDSMAFLGGNNFDFNKLFREGLSYCDEDEAKRLRDNFEKKVKLIENNDYKKNGDEQDVAVPLEERELVDRLTGEIEEFLKSSDDEKYIARNCNAFQRKLIYQLLERRYEHTISASSCNESNQKVILLKKLQSKEQQREIQLEEINKERIQIEDVIGFSNFIQFLSQTKKLIVGHNMLLDVIYIMKQFVGPISNKLQEFKTKTHKTFPNLLDTKYMCTDDEIKPFINSSVLARLLETTSIEPFERPKFEAESKEYSYSLDDPKEHEAGYDSFITGVCFATMANYLNICDISEKSPRLRQIINRFFTPVDVNHINLTGKEPSPPSRDHVFHLKIPNDWTNNNIYQMFRTYGNVRISWLDDTSCFVALHNRENATGLLKVIGKYEGVTMVSFADYKAK
ncbi:Poly(A)-specific ribonuclease PARN, partial [Pseudolycoriella hygida]